MARAFLLRPFFFSLWFGLLLFGRHFLVLTGRRFFRDCSGIYFHLIPVQEEGRRIVTDDRAREANAVVLGQAGDVWLRSFLGCVRRSSRRSGGPNFHVHIRGGGALHFVFVGAGKLRAADGEPGLFGFISAAAEIGQNG